MAFRASKLRPSPWCCQQGSSICELSLPFEVNRTNATSCDFNPKEEMRAWSDFHGICSLIAFLCNLQRLVQRCPNRCYAPSSGFLNLLTVYSANYLPALFHAGYACRVPCQSQLLSVTSTALPQPIPSWCLKWQAVNHKTPRKIPLAKQAYQSPSTGFWWQPRVEPNTSKKFLAL